MTRLLLVGAGGFLGAVARYGLSEFVQRLHGGSWPAGTLVVNVFGCVLIGAAMSMVEDAPFFTPSTRLFLIVGVLGGFTTFSAFGHETFELLRSGGALRGMLHASAHLVLGVGGVWTGWAVGKLFA